MERSYELRSIGCPQIRAGIIAGTALHSRPIRAHCFNLVKGFVSPRPLQSLRWGCVAERGLQTISASPCCKNTLHWQHQLFSWRYGGGVPAECSRGVAFASAVSPRSQVSEESNVGNPSGGYEETSRGQPSQQLAVLEGSSSGLKASTSRQIAVSTEGEPPTSLGTKRRTLKPRVLLNKQTGVGDQESSSAAANTDAKTKRALKAMLGAYQKRGREAGLGSDEDGASKEERDLDEAQDGGPDNEAVEVRFSKKPRKRALSDEDREQRREFIAAKLGLDEEESHIVNTSMPAKLTIRPLEERLDALSALGLDTYQIVLAILRYPGIVSIDRFRNYGPNIEYLQGLGIEKEALPTIILRHPRILVLNMKETVEPMVTYLRSLDLGDDAIRRMVLACPALAHKDAERVMKPRVQVLQAFGMPPDRITSMVRKVPAVLALFSPSRMAANLMYLVDLGMSRKEIILLTSRNPEVVGHSIKDNVEPKIDWLQSMGMTRLEAARVILNKPKLSPARMQARVSDLLEYGFTQEQVMGILSRHSPVLGLSRENLFAKLAFIENVMGQPKAEIALWPTGLCYSLQGRIAPRWEAAVEAGIQHTTNWRTLILATQERFEVMKLGQRQRWKRRPQTKD